MTQSTVTFVTPDGLQLTRQGAVTAAELIEQATAEFGAIDVLNSQDGDLIPDPDGVGIAALINNLHAAKINIQTALDQIASAEHIRLLPDVKLQLSEAITAIDVELSELTNA